MQVSSVENHPALLLLRALLQPATLATPSVHPSSDAADISAAAKQLAQTRPAEV